ncbi:MAG: nuclear transport factor 2 family protein [Chitinophagaceae bacterium]|nr:nuclear transport factor 2 family protein [Chitinophagaceae bacterium]
MKAFITLALLIGFSVSSNAQTDLKTIQEIEKVCSYYLDGGTNGDSVMFSKSFLPEGTMMYMRNDTLKTVSLKQFMAGFRNTGQKANRKTRIESIQVFGNAAVAKLTCEYETFYFHDLMQLLKTKDGWIIVSKIFHREDKVVSKPN